MGCEDKSKKLEFSPGDGLIHLFAFPIFTGHHSPLATMWFRITIFKGILFVFFFFNRNLLLWESLQEGRISKGHWVVAVALRAGGHNLLCLIYWATSGPAHPSRGIFVLIWVPDIYLYINNVYIYVIFMSYLYLWMPLGPDWALLGDFGVPLVAQGLSRHRMCQLHFGCFILTLATSLEAFSASSAMLLWFWDLEKVLCIPPALRAELWAASFGPLCWKPTKIKMICNTKPARLLVLLLWRCTGRCFKRE